MIVGEQESCWHRVFNRVGNSRNPRQSSIYLYFGSGKDPSKQASDELGRIDMKAYLIEKIPPIRRLEE
jgi:hypothetical protein